MSMKLGGLIIAVSALRFGVFLISTLRESRDTARMLEKAIQDWEAKDLPAGITWQVQEHLSSLQWLGSLRPDPPHDPLKVCGIPAKRNWWVLVLRVTKTRQLLTCLEENILKAEEAHSAFRYKMTLFIVVFLAITVKFFAALSVRIRRSARTAQKDDGAGTNHVVDSSTMFDENSPSTDEGEVSSGSLSPRDKTDIKKSVGHEEIGDISPKSESPTEESKIHKGDTEEEEGTRIAEVSLGPHCSVVTTVTNIPPSMSAEEVQHAIDVMVTDVQAQKDKIISGELRAEDIEQLLSEIWKSSIESGKS